jgi:hypothetical protein
LSGTVNISRDLWADEAFAREAFSEREAWVWMICEASWKPRKKRIGDAIVDLGRGQLAASIRFMADAFGWHRNKAHRFIQRLEKLGLISVKTGTGVSVITICNYNKYQHGGTAGGTGPGQDRDTSGTNYKKGEIREEGNGGGGSACAREAETTQDQPTDRERILDAIGVGPDGLAGPSRFIGGQGDMAEAQRWLALPGLDLETVCRAIREVMAAKRDGPPANFRYFTPALQRLSAQLTAPALTPQPGTGPPRRTGQPSFEEIMAMMTAGQEPIQ